MHPAIFLMVSAAATPVCVEVTHHADGTVSERTVADDGGTSASASSSSRGSGSAHSSVAASSSSSSRGTSSSSFAGDHGRSVKVERAGDKCRITIIER